jgi:prepilin-type N-terminal cleavage/methylation domain-containing protein
MMLRRLRKLNKKQQGFTLIEILSAVAILGIISIPLAMGIFQTYDISVRSASNITAINDVQTAIDWITRDAQMAQEVTVVPSSGSPLESFQLSWMDWDGGSHVVDYNIIVVDGIGQLRRTTNGRTLVIMENVDLTHTSCVNNADGTLDFILTSSVSDYRSASETRSFTILRRSGR